MQTNLLLKCYKYEGDSRPTFAKRQCALDVWVGMICGTTDLVTSGIEELPTVTDDRYFIPSRESTDQTRYNGLENLEGWRPSFSVLASWKVPIFRLVWPASQPMFTRRWLRKLCLWSCSAWKKDTVLRFLSSLEMAICSMGDMAGTGLMVYETTHICFL